MFRFKQFSVDQSGCAMKINTDGVLLGAMVHHAGPGRILDIGTGTGVITLMLVQKYADAVVDAVETDRSAAGTAGRNFEGSVFHSRLHIHSMDIDDYFAAYPDVKFDMVVSNPPFYINSLESPQKQKRQAKHTDVGFFERLIKGVSEHLSPGGLCWMILPVDTAGEVKLLAARYGMYLQQMISISSFADSEPHREIVCFGLNKGSAPVSKFVIYEAVGEYSEEYKELLQPYFLAF